MMFLRAVTYLGMKTCRAVGYRVGKRRAAKDCQRSLAACEGTRLHTPRCLNHYEGDKQSKIWHIRKGVAMYIIPHRNSERTAASWLRYDERRGGGQHRQETSGEALASQGKERQRLETPGSTGPKLTLRH
jgi:hypothetical protein